MDRRRRAERITAITIVALGLVWWFVGRDGAGHRGSSSPVSAATRPWTEGLLVESYGTVAPALPVVVSRRVDDTVAVAMTLYRDGVRQTLLATTPAPSTAELTRVGQTLRETMRRTMPPSRDAAARARLAEIVSRIRGACPGDTGARYDLDLLETSSVNAYMGPGGLGAVLRGLLDRLDDDEVAFVVAHEFAHGILGHSDRMVHLAMARIRARQRFSDGVGIPLPEILGQVAQHVLTSPYDQELEFEADRLGLALAWKAGYEPAAMSRAMVKLGGPSRPRRGLLRMGYDVIDSHPPAEVRRQYGETLARIIRLRHSP